MRHGLILLTFVAALGLTATMATADESAESDVQVASSQAIDVRLDSNDTPLSRTASSSCLTGSVPAESKGAQDFSGGNPPCLICEVDRDCVEWGETFCQSIQGAFCGPPMPSCGTFMPVCQCVSGQ